MKWKMAKGLKGKPSKGLLPRRAHLRFLVLNWMRMDPELVFLTIAGTVQRRFKAGFWFNAFTSQSFMDIGSVIVDMKEFEEVNLVARLREIPLERRQALSDEAGIGVPFGGPKGSSR